MATFTLATLRTRAKRLADEEYSARLADAEWDAHLDAANGELYDILVTTSPDRYVTVNTSLSILTAGGYLNLSLITDFYKLLGVDKYVGPSAYDYVTLGRFNFRERNNLSTLSYRISGTTFLNVYPAEDSVGTYRIWYIPACPTFTASVNYPNGWEEYIVLGAAIAAAVKEESDPGVLMARRATLEKKIREAANDNDAGEPGTVSDVRGFDDPLGQRWWY